MSELEEINSNDHMKLAEELRKRMKGVIEPYIYEDIDMFQRFLKAQDYDIEKSEETIKKHVEWSKKKDIKNILNYPLPEVIRKYCPYNFLGYDKNGCIIRYSPIGNIDTTGLLNSLRVEDIEKSTIHFLEDDETKIRQLNKEMKKNTGKCIYIMDLENYQYTKFLDKRFISALIMILTIYKDNYPERMKACYVINGNFIVSYIYAHLKRFLPEAIFNKFHFYYDDSWKEDLLKEIGSDVLPAFLGGKKTDPDGNPRCLTFISYGEPVPKSYYLPKSKKVLAGKEGVKKITLSRAQYHEEILEIKEEFSTLEWEFETECRDIGFGVFYEEVADKEKKMVELIPHLRIDTETAAETGTWLCQNVGNYVFLFDNTYSWLRSKEIYYRIKVIPPTLQESKESV